MGFSHVTNSDPLQPSGAFAAEMTQYDAQIFDVAAKEALGQRLQSMLEAGQQGDTASVVAQLQQLKTAAGYADSRNVNLKELFGEGGLGGLLSGQPPKALDNVASMMQAPHLLGPKDSATSVSLWSLLEDPDKQISIDITPTFSYIQDHGGLLPSSGDDSWNGPSWYSDGTDFGGSPANALSSAQDQFHRMANSLYGSPACPKQLEESGFVINTNYHQRTYSLKGDTYTESTLDSVSMQGSASSFAAWIAGSSNFCSTLQQLLQ